MDQLVIIHQAVFPIILDNENLVLPVDAQKNFKNKKIQAPVNFRK